MKIPCLSTCCRSGALLLAILFLFIRPGFSQTTAREKEENGKITGKVVDAGTGENIIGAHVVITGTGNGDATDFDGIFTIDNLEPGLYSITASYISYSGRTVAGVEVKPGEATVVPVALQLRTLDLNGVIVTAAADQSGEAGLLAMQKKADAIQDGLSSEQIAKSGDGNVASALKRIAGVSLAGGNDLYIRGLGNRYSRILLNGSPVPSVSPNKQEAPVDILSSGVVDHIVVRKTFTPDQAGEFSGGSVQIVTTEFPDDRHLNFSYTTSYNSLSTFKNHLGYKGSATDFLGYDSGQRALPAEVKDGVISSAREAGKVAGKLHNNWSPRTYRSLPAQKFNVSYADQFNEDKLPVGIVSNLSYKITSEARSDEVYRFIRNYRASDGTVLLGSDYIRNTGTEKTHMSGMFNLFVKPAGNIKVGLKNLYSNASQDRMAVITGSYYSYDGVNRQTIMEFDRRSVYSSSLHFESFFRDFYESDFSATLSYSRVIRDTPDRRNTQYVKNDNGLFELLLADRGNLHFFSDQDDRNITGKADYRLKPLSRLTVKTGVMGVLKDHDFNAWRLLYQDLNHDFPASQKTAAPEAIFTRENIETGGLELIENTQIYDSYEGGQELYAGYISAGLAVTDRLAVGGGIRLEYSTQKVNGETLIAESDYLPAINTTYSATDATNIRGAFSITLARPGFRELSNFNFQDFIGGRTVYGNPELEQTRIYNYDLRLETYPNSGELLAASFFYKRFENPIELFYRITQNNEVFYGNVPGASLMGFEVEARKDLTERLRVTGNFSYIISSVEYEGELTGARQANEERPMFGQSPYTLNLGIYYLIPSVDVAINALYNTFGKRISAVGNARQPGDEYEQPFHKADLNLSKRFGKASVSVEVENLLNDDVVFRQGEVITTAYEVGTTWSLGFSYAF